jgi:hypothetical protein
VNFLASDHRSRAARAIQYLKKQLSSDLGRLLKELKDVHPTAEPPDSSSSALENRAAPVTKLRLKIFALDCCDRADGGGRAVGPKSEARLSQSCANDFAANLVNLARMILQLEEESKSAPRRRVN